MVQDFSFQFTVLYLLTSVVLDKCITTFIYPTAYRQRNDRNEIILPPIITDIELAIQNEIPSGNVQLNALYVPKSQYNLDKFALIIIEKKANYPRKLLGSGAFGKVHQGIFKDFKGSDTMHVAIKMLRENATSRKKMEFLEEANLMKS
ncbi:proto-oncogene tyrosine-protein kinase ros, partial [Lasius niger]